ncbi:hypothetical protein SLS62_008997 [Diatrype stigma]|uniref:Uncharacterized protein n=1 Tax=Diatrype stigma TaxID=117547 RepID=A0AAN9UH03_9PEZI
MKLPTVLLSGLAALANAAAAADRRTATIYIQPIVLSSASAPSSQDSAPEAPVPLATVEYDPAWKPASSSSRPSSAADPDADSDPAAGGAGQQQQQEIEILSYEAPELPELPDTTPQLVRVGVWDPSRNRWISSTTVASAENFAKGYAPVLAVTVSSPSSSSPAAASGKNSKGAGGDIISVAVKGVAVDAGYTRDFGPKAVLVRTEPGRQVELNRPVVLGPEGRTVEAEPEKSLLQKYWWVIGIIVLLTVTGGGGEGGK